MSTLVSWGGNRDGQLGIGSLEKIQAETPTELSSLRDVEVRGISCGDYHTVIVLEDGSVYSCGSNEEGQLGHEKRQSRPELVDALSKHRVVQVSAGMAHSIFLTELGRLFSCGANKEGQLGREEPDQDKWRIPTLIRLPSTVIVQVACGKNHCVALSDEGLAYSWGENRNGQLGLGHTNNMPRPMCITCLRGVPIAQLACGGYHSFILSMSGTLFGFGRNCFGQLGMNDEKDRLHPTLCKSLRLQKITYITCGEDHSAALTQTGGLFTFGAGTFGQLGHGYKSHEILPRKVSELMGSSVTQVSCGRRHSMAYVGESGKLYVFGSGSNHQLGNGSMAIVTVPSAVNGYFKGAAAPGSTPMDTSNGTMFVINRIAAGGDHCFVWATDPVSGLPPSDFRVWDPQTQIKHLSPELIDEICKLNVGDDVPKDLEKKVEKVFSSAACINASFLKAGDAHFGSGSKNHGVDMDLVRKNFTKVADSSNVKVKQKIQQVLEGTLLPSLPNSPPDVEALRVYLILPELPFFEQPKYYSTLLEPFARSIISLDKPASKVLDIWWSSFCATYFLRIVYVYKETVMFILNLPEPKAPAELDCRLRGLHSCLELLKKLSTVNEQHQILEYHKFYISQLQEKVNLREDYIKWVQMQNARKDIKKRPLLCDYPFTFDAAAKTLLLQTDALLQMRSAIEDVQRRNIQSLFLPINPVNPCLVFFVSRDNIVRETLQQLIHHGSADLKKPLKVVFAGEEAMDEGGVRKEFFMLLLRELLDPKYGMFVIPDETSRLQWFNPFPFEEKQMYLLIGVLCGLAIYNSVIIQLDFPLALYKKLRAKASTLEDLSELMPTVARGLKELLSYEGDDVEDVYCLNFEIVQERFGEAVKKELEPGGANKAVTKVNRKEYVDLYVDYIFNKSVEDQFCAFGDGFHRVCGGRVLELFHPQELKAMVVGNENYDFHELEKNTTYKGDYHRYHQTIKFFWDVFHDLSLDDKKNFLLFLTGSNKIPISGMKSVKIFIQPMRVPEKYLPVAHTCFNLLDLPEYSSKEILKQKLLQAIQQTEGFGLV